MGVGAVIVLGAMAGRYGRMLQGGRLPSKHAVPVRAAPVSPIQLAEIEAFAAVRARMRREIQTRRGLPLDARELDGIRERALTATAISYERYAAVRSGYRAWREGRLAPEPAAGFDARRQLLLRADLGTYERLDR